MALLWLVTIHYSEPTFDQWNERKEVVRSQQQLVSADSSDLARRLAQRTFEDVAARSGVGWVRIVKAVDVQCAEGRLAQAIGGGA